MSTNKYWHIMQHSYIVYMVVMLWLPMGRPADVENIGLSAWPDNTIWVVWYTLTKGFSLSGTEVTLHSPASVTGYRNTTHVGHGSFVYITMNPAVLSHSCAFPWLRL